MIEDNVAQLSANALKNRRIPAEQTRIIRAGEIEGRRQQYGAAIGLIGDFALVDHFLSSAGGNSQRNSVHIETGTSKIGHRGDAFFGADRGTFACRAKDSDTIAAIGQRPSRVLAERWEINHILTGERGRQCAAQTDPACCFF